MNEDTIENKISSAKEYLNILGEYKECSKKDLEEDVAVRSIIERHLHLAVESTIKIAQAAISVKGFRKPKILSENFIILEEEGVIEKELADKLIKMVGFRNIIVHDYEKIDYDIVLDVLENRLVDIEKFVEIIEKEF